MSEPRFKAKVGIFVLIALVLLGALIINFSKGLSIFKPTYQVWLKTSNVAGIKPQASVMISGVEVGKVVGARLSEDGKFVHVQMKIYQRFKIHSDAQFSIDSLGFLGDQYIAIKPTKNEAPALKEGDEVTAEEAFSMQELAKAGVGFINRLDTTVKRINDVVTRVDRIVLNDANLTNLSMTISSFRQASEGAVDAVNSLGVFVRTNSAPFNAAVTNLAQFTDRLGKLGTSLDEIVATNGVEISVAVKNFQLASADLKMLTGELQSGKGLAGGLLKDEQMKAEFTALITNLNAAAGNFSALGSNINHQGLWHILWKPKQPKSVPEKGK
jgi:phospholipid/cholesterol/gamma-HCH transport system substrate-binding protein